MESDSATATGPDHLAALKALDKWPESPTRAALPPPFINAAGSIQNLLEEPCGGVAIIHSKAGSIRSQHYHRTDSHYLYVLSGRMLYFERPVGSKELPEPVEVRAGQMVFTPPLVEHATSFDEDTVLVSMSKNARTTEKHEADLVRVKVI
jgi:quercetin dioxygenase-like cupin family protein